MKRNLIILIFIAALALMFAGCNSLLNPGYKTHKPNISTLYPYKSTMKEVDRLLGNPAIASISFANGKQDIVYTYFYRTPNAIVDTKKMMQGNYKQGCQGCGTIKVYSKYKNLMTGISVSDEEMEREFEVAMNYIEEKNFADAYKILDALAKQNYTPAQHNLGLMYVYGDGVKPDYSKAAQMFALGAASQYHPAIYDLAVFYKNTKNLKAATELFEEAASFGNQMAIKELIKIYTAKKDSSKVAYYKSKLKK